MTDATTRKWNCLRECAWFSQVGRQPVENMLQVRTWLHAVACCASLSWENAQIEALNELGAKVQMKDRTRYFGVWNPLAKEATKAADALIADLLMPILHREKLPGIIRQRISHDLSGIYLEFEYSDIATPGFFTRLAEVYQSGHFPCGWEGEYPDGRLIIF